MAARDIPLKRRNLDNPQIKSYTEAIRRGQKNIHVIHKEGRWEVKRIGNRDIGTFDTQDEAMRHATRVARDNRSELIIHDRSGLIRERHSYAEDPYRPRG